MIQSKKEQARIEELESINRRMPCAYEWWYIGFYSELYRDSVYPAMREMALKQLDKFCSAIMQNSYNG